MKLYDWLLKEDITNVGTRLEYRSEGLHVIGTCGKCKYYEVTAIESVRNNNWCHNSRVQIELDTSEGECVLPTKDFGCIHFEGKGEK